MLLTLRIAPTLAFTSPFTLVRVPSTVRLLLSVSLASWMAAASPAQTWERIGSIDALPVEFAAELVTGLALSLPFQIAFGALLTVGRTIDIQAGYGLAALVDPTTRSQLPLVGSLLSYAAGAIFFATDGPLDLIALWSASLDKVPLGTIASGDVGAVAQLLASFFLLAFGVGSIIILALFLADMAIAFMSRTMPQMNVLLLGFQVKVLLTLLLLPPALALSGAVLLRLLRLAIVSSTDLL